MHIFFQFRSMIKLTNSFRNFTLLAISICKTFFPTGRVFPASNVVSVSSYGRNLKKKSLFSAESSVIFQCPLWYPRLLRNKKFWDKWQVVERPTMAGVIHPNQKELCYRKYRSELSVKGMNRPIQGGPSEYLILKKIKATTLRPLVIRSQMPDNCRFTIPTDTDNFYVCHTD